MLFYKHCFLDIGNTRRNCCSDAYYFKRATETVIYYSETDIYVAIRFIFTSERGFCWAELFHCISSSVTFQQPKNTLSIRALTKKKFHHLTQTHNVNLNNIPFVDFGVLLQGEMLVFDFLCSVSSTFNFKLLEHMCELVSFSVGDKVTNIMRFLKLMV